MLPNVARYQLRHTPKCEKYSIFRSISVSGQICGQNILSVFFLKRQTPEKVSVYKGVFSMIARIFVALLFARSAFLPAGASPPPACSQTSRAPCCRFRIALRSFARALRRLPLLFPRFFRHRRRSETSPAAPHPERKKILNF